MRLTKAEAARIAAQPGYAAVGLDDEPPTPAQAALVQASQTSPLEDRFYARWQDVGGPALEREVRFHPTRRWRFDFADPQKKIAYEIQGGLYQAQSGHRSHDGVRRDAEKLNAAQLLGWRVFQITTYTLKDAEYMTELAQWHREQLPKESEE